MHFDVIIVGARCAGASLATHLARSGAKVLLLEASELPSDHVLSTHFVQPPGMAALDAVGVGARVRSAEDYARVHARRRHSLVTAQYGVSPM